MTQQLVRLGADDKRCVLGCLGCRLLFTNTTPAKVVTIFACYKGPLI